MNLNKIKRRDFVKTFSFLPFIGFGLSSRASKIFNIEEILEPWYLGKLDAPIKFIEFVSMTCSHCADFHKDVYPGLKENYIDTGLASIEFKSFFSCTAHHSAFLISY